MMSGENLSFQDMPSSCIQSLALINGNRRSAFLPYKPNCTVLTNLQRGNTEANVNSEIALSFHERSGQGEITDDQAKQELKIDLLDRYKYTPLHWACYYGQLNSVHILIKYGADVNKQAPDMISPLLLASAGGHHEVVKCLLQNGANAHHMDIIGNTALMYAASGNHPHTSNELLAHNLNVTTTNVNGDTAYSLAVKNNSFLAQAVLENNIVSMLTL